MFVRVRNLPVHKSMREISELIYETCKTYLLTQIKFILILEVLIGAIILVYFGVFRQLDGLPRRAIMFWSLRRHRRQLRRRVVRHPHQHVRQQPCGLRRRSGQALPDLRHPAAGGHEHRRGADRDRARADADHPALRPR
jgi:hypothetical protein